jgi:4-aminobutyrate aminotransferase-like enzyme
VPRSLWSFCCVAVASSDDAFSFRVACQTGFGRLGCWWGFETLGVVPDIVTTGKPIGNGYPMAAVVCTEAVATAFHNGMEYFNSCAGTNTAAAVGIAVLDCIEQQRLVDHADTVGRLLLLHLRELAVGFPWISGVRGQGLFLGVDIETGRSSARAASSSSKRSASFRITLRQLPPKLPECRCAEGASLPPSPACPLDSGSVCSWLCTALMLCSPMGILAGTDGPRHNVLKLKPPMVFDERDAEYCVQGLQACLEAFQRLHPCTQAVAPRELPSKL